MLTPLVNNRDLTSRFFKDSIDHNLGVTKFLTADVVMSNNATDFQDVVDLTSQLDADGGYVFTSCFYITSPSIVDIQVRFDFFLSSNPVKVLWGDSTTTATGGAIRTATRTIQTSGGLDAVTPSGWIENLSGSTFPISVMFSQGTVSASSTLFKTGSWLHIVRVF